MGKYSDMVLLGNLAEEENEKPKPGFKASDVLLGPEPEKIMREYSPTGTISAITGKPEMKWTPTGESGASFGALAKTGFVDDPITQIKIFAKSRGIPVDRYRIVKGEIVYQGEDGNWYPETHQDALGKLKRAAGQGAGDLPALVGGIAGSAYGGVPGATGGAMLGEATRKGIGKFVFDEPVTPLGATGDIIKEGALALTGELGGKIAKAGINRLGAKRGGQLAVHAGRDRKLIDLVKEQEMRALGKEVGIDLTTAQTAGSKRLADKFNLLGDLEASSDLIQAVRKSQQKQISNAVYTFLDAVSPVPKGGKLGLGDDLVKAAKTSVGRPVQIRQAKAAPIYQKAFAETSDVDIKPVVGLIDEGLKTAKADMRTGLLKAKKMLTNPDLPKEKKLLDATGKEIGIEQQWDTSLKGLHDAKMALDNEIAKAKRSGANPLARQYQQIKTKLLEQMDGASPDYKRAREVFSEYSDEVNKQGTKTLVSELTKLEGDQVVKASKNLFTSVASTPETMAKARRLIMRENPEAWDAALRTNLQEIFEKTKASAGGVDVTTNIGGNFYKRTLGDPQQRKTIQAAMSPGQFEYFEKLMKVLDRSGMILRKESATATRGEMIEEIGGSTVRRTVKALTQPMYTKDRVVGEWLIKVRLGRNARALAEAMVNEKGAKQLQKMYQLGPRSENLIPMMGDFITILGGGAIGRGTSRMTTGGTSESELLQ